MAEFSIQDAAFTGFRVVREHPRAVIVWALFQLAVSLVFGAVVVLVGGPAVMQLRALAVGATLDPAQAGVLLGRLTPIYAFILPLLLVFDALLFAAMNRVVLRPADERFGYFRLGADELRQLGLQILALAVFVGAYLALVVVAVLLSGAVAVASKPAGAMVGVISAVVILLALVFLGVRLSLASAMTFETRKVDLFGSWRATRGRFWPILGTYVLTFALVVVVYLLSLLVIVAVAAVVSGGNPMGAMMRPDVGSIRAWLSPVVLIQTVLGAGVSALVWPLMFTPAAAIYRQLSASAIRG